jgi:hemolysin activation/secretion protein
MVRLKANYTHIIDFSEKHIFEYQAYVNGRQYFHLNNLNSVIIGNTISYNYFQDDKNRWYSRIAYDAGQDLAQYQELTAGDLTGLRGYPTDYLRGKKRYVFSLERRYFSDVHLFNLMRIGGVVFLDVGKAWGLPDQTYAPVLSNLGIGLRFSSSKIRVGNVVHINVATPTSAKEGISRYQVMIGAEQKF